MILINASPLDKYIWIHTLFEILGYSAVGIIFKSKWHSQNDIFKTPSISGAVSANLFLMTAAFAMVGAIIVNLIENASRVIVALEAGAIPPVGKSILGGIVFGIIGVELGKLIFLKKQERVSTGNKWILPLAIGTAIGRIGCQICGLPDGTFGSAVPAWIPLAWDYGDGVARYPVALMEILFVLTVGWLLHNRVLKTKDKSGIYFNYYIFLYCAWRVFIEFFKPPFDSSETSFNTISIYWGLTGLQWFAVVSAVWMLIRIAKQRFHQHK